MQFLGYINKSIQLKGESEIEMGLYLIRIQRTIISKNLQLKWSSKTMEIQITQDLNTADGYIFYY